MIHECETNEGRIEIRDEKGSVLAVTSNYDLARMISRLWNNSGMKDGTVVEKIFNFKLTELKKFIDTYQEQPRNGTSLDLLRRYLHDAWKEAEELCKPQ